MAWNPSPEVQKAREFGDTFGFSQVVIVGINRTWDGGKMMVTSYGTTKDLCNEAKALGRYVNDAVMNYYREDEQ